MQIPNAEQAYVPREKLIGYLLDPGHPVGGPKARFFLAHGYTEGHAAELERGLLAIAQRADAEPEESRHGTKYVADGSLDTPRGTTGLPYAFAPSGS